MLYLLLAPHLTASAMRQVALQNWGCTVNGQNFSYPDPNPLVIPLGSVVSYSSSAVFQKLAAAGSPPSRPCWLERWFAHAGLAPWLPAHVRAAAAARPVLPWLRPATHPPSHPACLSPCRWSGMSVGWWATRCTCT